MKVSFKGCYRLKHIRNGRLLRHYKFNNTVVNAGLDEILVNTFVAGNSAHAWYIGLIDSVSFTSISKLDTMDDHSGWLEFISYNESERQLWLAELGSTSGTLVNGLSTTFTISANGTLRGAFLSDDSAIGGTDGVLFSAAPFYSGNVQVEDGDIIKVQYRLEAKSS